MQNLEENSSFAQMKELMETEPELRKPDQIKILESLLLQFPFFLRLKQEYHINNVVDCAIYFCYKTYSPKELVFEAGQYASTFYVLLKGEVAILKNNTIIRKYSEGPIEECCLSERRKYDTSATAVKESHIVFVDYQIYAGLFMNIREKRRIAMASFLQIQKEFKEWSKAKLMSLSYFIIEIEAKPGVQVFKIGDPCDKIFIVQDGSVVLKSSKIEMCGAGDVIGINDLKYATRRSMCVSHGLSTLLYLYKFDYLEALKTLPKVKKIQNINFKYEEVAKPIGMSIQSFVPEQAMKMKYPERRSFSGVRRPSSHNTYRTRSRNFTDKRVNTSFQMRNTARVSFF